MTPDGTAGGGERGLVRAIATGCVGWMRYAPASALLLVVGLSSPNKTYDALRAISENLIPVEPTVDAIKGGLSDAVAGIDVLRGLGIGESA